MLGAWRRKRIERVGSERILPANEWTQRDDGDDTEHKGQTEIAGGVELEAQPCHSWTLGSATPIAMSTKKLITTNSTDSSKATPVSAGKSRFVMAWTVYCPRPGRRKIVSTNTAPVRRYALSIPSWVRIGAREFLSTCLLRTARLASPLARADR